MCTPHPYVVAVYPNGRDIWLLDTDLCGKECELCRSGTALAKYAYWTTDDEPHTAWAHFECVRQKHPLVCERQAVAQ
jgi:hypothetical protein